MTESSAREAARKLWTAHPIGLNLVDAEEETIEFYRQLTHARYREQPWLPDLIHRWHPTGRLLEIGCGPGTDHAVLASIADETMAIDLSERGVRLTSTRLRLEGRRGQARVADAESLPFEDSSFDSVYSFGVIHHTDHPDLAAREMARVLRPGGRFLVALYHRHSLYAIDTMARWLVKCKWRHETWRNYLARCEFGSVDQPQRPMVRLYSRRSATNLFKHAGLRQLSVTTRHAYGFDHYFSGRWAQAFGWYVIVTGRR